MISMNCRECSRGNVGGGFIWMPPGSLSYAIEACPPDQIKAVHKYGHAIVDGTISMGHPYREATKRHYSDFGRDLLDANLDPMATQYAWDVVSNGIETDSIRPDAESRKNALRLAREFQIYADRLLNETGLSRYSDDIIKAVRGMGELSLSFTGGISQMDEGVRQYRQQVLEPFAFTTDYSRRR